MNYLLIDEHFLSNCFLHYIKPLSDIDPRLFCLDLLFGYKLVY